MKGVLIKIFEECGFQIEEFSGILFCSRLDDDKIEYYLVAFVSKFELVNEFDAQLEAVRSVFDSRRKLQKDIDKNTSLLICVEFDSYRRDIPNYKNKMLKIEEDDFFYRKYFLPYTLGAIKELEKDENVVEILNVAIMNNEKFEGFGNDIYSDEAYFLVVQLFIKLPFLNISVGRTGQLTSINELLEKQISLGDKTFFDQVLSNYPLERFSSEDILMRILDPKDRFFDDFLNSFEKDDSAS